MAIGLGLPTSSGSPEIDREEAMGRPDGLPMDLEDEGHGPTMALFIFGG